MKALIIGGGKVGYYLFKTLLHKKYDVTLIEMDRDVCSRIAEELNADVICGDGTNIDVLKDAGIEEANTVAAVTGKDEENFVICQVAKINFNVNKTIARINNPKNKQVFKRLGVDKTVCSTEVIANLVENELEETNLKIVQTLERGEMILTEARITENCVCCNKLVKNLSLPPECVITSLLRGDKVLFPRGNLEILENDTVLLVTNAQKKDDVERSIIGG